MKLLSLVITLAVLVMMIPNVSASIYIYLDKDSVNLGDTIRVQVATDSPILTPFEILVEGGGNSILLCRSEGGENITDACGKNEWVVEIPDDWNEGTYILKVLINDVEPMEFFDDFKVVKPKITSVEVPKLVYQGKTRIKVGVETANITSTSLTLKLRGSNVDFVVVEGTNYNESGDNQYIYDVDLNLRENYELTHDRSQAIQPGKYVLEVKLSHKGKIWDSRMIVVDLLKPKLNLSVESVAIGNPLIVDVHTNRVHDYGYDGIIVILVGQNYILAKKAILDDDGNAKVQFETAGLDAGKYTVYVRDTSLTTTLSLDVLAKEYYDLEPNQSYSKVIQADDDVLVKKEVWLKSDLNESLSHLHFKPVGCEVEVNSTVTLDLLIDGVEKDINAYQIVVSLRGSENVAEIAGITLPDWATLIERTTLPRYAAVSAANFEDGNVTSVLAKITLRTLKPGVALLELSEAKVYDGDGKLIDIKTSDAYIKVVETGNKTVKEVIKSEKPASSSAMLVQTEVTATLATTTTVATTVTTTTAGAKFPVDFKDIDYRKVVMFMIAFSVTYTAGKMLRNRKAVKAGK